MATLLALVSVVLIVIVLLDTFETMLLPRRVRRQFRFARIFYVYSWSAGLRSPGGSHPTSAGTRS